MVRFHQVAWQNYPLVWCCTFVGGSVRIRSLLWAGYSRVSWLTSTPATNFLSHPKGVKNARPDMPKRIAPSFGRGVTPW